MRGCRSVLINLMISQKCIGNIIMSISILLRNILIEWMNSIILGKKKYLGTLKYTRKKKEMRFKESIRKKLQKPRKNLKKKC